MNQVKKTVTFFLCFLALLLSLSATVSSDQPVPQYGRGVDVYTTSSGAAVDGDVLLLTWPSEANHEERFLVAVDISDKKQPELLDRLALEGFPQDLVLHGDYAYVVNGRDLIVIDVLEPDSLRVVNSLRINDDPLRGPQGVAFQDDLIWLACRLGGIKAVDVADHDSLEVIAAADIQGFARGLTVTDELLYVAADTRGVFTFDIKTPERPVLLHHESAPEGCIGRIRVHGEFAYLAGGNVMAACLSLDNPRKPRWVGATDGHGLMSPFYGAFSHDVRLTEMESPETGQMRTLAVIADGEGGLIVTDVSRPGEPQVLGVVKPEGLGGPYVATGLALQESMVFLIDQFFGLRIIDISRPDTPVQIEKGLRLNG